MAGFAAAETRGASEVAEGVADRAGAARSEAALRQVERSAVEPRPRMSRTGREPSPASELAMKGVGARLARLEHVYRLWGRVPLDCTDARAGDDHRAQMRQADWLEAAVAGGCCIGLDGAHDILVRTARHAATALNAMRLDDMSSEARDEILSVATTLRSLGNGGVGGVADRWTG